MIVELLLFFPQFGCIDHDDDDDDDEMESRIGK